MAATRITLPQTKIRREVYRWFCPTCGRRVMRDGRNGARNNMKFCDFSCYTKHRTYATPGRVFNSTLNASVLGSMPASPLGS